MVYVINNNLFEQAILLFNQVHQTETMDTIKLIDALELLRDGTHNPPKRVEQGIPLLMGQTVNNGFVTYDKMTYISECDYQKIHVKYQPQNKDLIITKIGTVGKVAILREFDIPMAIHCNSALIRFKSNLMSQEWGFFLLNSLLFQNEFRNRVTNTVQDFVSLGRMEDILIPIPSNDIKSKYDVIFKNYLEKLSTINIENAHLSNLRDTLLPKLMSGEIDVSSINL